MAKNKKKPRSKLPPITKEEKIGIKLLQEYLDGADYKENAIWKVDNKEHARLMNLGFARYFAEETQE